MTEEYGHISDAFHLSEQEVEKLRKSKKELTDYGKQKLKELMTEYQPTPQSPEEVAEGLRNAFRQAKKDGVMDATPYLKQMTDQTDIQKTEKEIAVLQKKLELLKEIEAHKSQQKPETLYDIIADWWDEIFLNNNEAAETIESLVDRIEKEWLPKPQSAAGSQNVYVECTVEGFNDCLEKIKRKLR